MSFDRHRQDWNHLAQADALWAVLTAPGTERGRWDVDEFFATGEIATAYRSRTRWRCGVACALLRRLGVSESWMLRRTSSTPMRMTWRPHEDVLQLLRDRGASLLTVESASDGVAPGRRYYVRPA